MRLRGPLAASATPAMRPPQRRPYQRRLAVLAGSARGDAGRRHRAPSAQTPAAQPWSVSAPAPSHALRCDCQRSGEARRKRCRLLSGIASFPVMTNAVIPGHAHSGASLRVPCTSHAMADIAQNPSSGSGALNSPGRRRPPVRPKLRSNTDSDLPTARASRMGTLGQAGRAIIRAAPLAATPRARRQGRHTGSAQPHRVVPCLGIGDQGRDVRVGQAGHPLGSRCFFTSIHRCSLSVRGW